MHEVILNSKLLKYMHEVILISKLLKYVCYVTVYASQQVEIKCGEWGSQASGTPLSIQQFA
jgi:hypothetical protein